MFTIKFYQMAVGGFRQVIRQAESFTVLRADDGSAEITLHQKNLEDSCRIDINDAPAPEGWPPRFESAIIENAAGRTTEIIGQPLNRPRSPTPDARR